MTTATRAEGAQSVTIPQLLIVALLGAALIFVAGLAQGDTLHDAAHDVRHATGFPCH